VGLTGKLPTFTAVISIGFLIFLLLWLLAKLQVKRFQALSDRFDRENEARKTLAQIVGGLLVLAGLYSSIQAFDL
jgi:predicted metal-binding membrane protein